MWSAGQAAECASELCPSGVHTLVVLLRVGRQGGGARRAGTAHVAMVTGCGAAVVVGQVILAWETAGLPVVAIWATEGL